MPAAIRWTAEEVADVIDSYLLRREPMTKIGRRYGVSEPSIRRLLTAKNVPIRDNSESHRTHSFDERFWDKIDTEAKAYWLGFVCGDGGFQRGRYLTIGLAAKDRQHLEKFRHDIQATYPVTTCRDGAVARIILCHQHLGGVLPNLGILPRGKREPSLNRSHATLFITISEVFLMLTERSSLAPGSRPASRNGGSSCAASLKS